MAYEVIARKWRPQVFDDVTGQEMITRTLRNAIEHDRLHQAYLFSGMRGVGKTTTARLLAKALNCHKAEKPTSNACSTSGEGMCASCREIAECRSIDVLEIDAASNTSVENVRDAIISTVAVRPARDRYRVFIIDEVHMLSAHAFNALLKTLEEPPPRTLFIMATTVTQKVPETILSRCQQFEFRAIPADKIAARLRLIADAESVDVEPQALLEIARFGEGSMRDAQSAFDQVISFTEAKQITVRDVENSLGIASIQLLERVMRAIDQKNAGEVIGVVDELVMRGHELRSFCRDMMAHVRDLLVMKTKVQDMNAEGAERESSRTLAETAALFSESDLVRFFNSLTETEKNIRENAHPRYQMELGLVKLLEMKHLAPLDRVLERLEMLEKALRPEAPGVVRTESVRRPNNENRLSSTDVNGVSSEKGATGATKSTGGGKAFSEEGGNGGNTKTGRLATAELVPALPEETESRLPPGSSAEEILQSLKIKLEEKHKLLFATALEGAESASLEADSLVLQFSPDRKHLRENLHKPDCLTLLGTLLFEITGRNLKLQTTTVASKTPAALASSTPENEAKRALFAKAEKHPTVQQVLRTFGGEIIDVRQTGE